ncbi:hypothetical protein AX15_003679 [Amanita polypyramis BW_CC]|nr:hypothetical protein AX15_003679 [Amanita polypyramis BW_CC]
MALRTMLTALAARIGRAQAEQEHKWMRQTVSCEPDLVAMIRRRLHGEPLQYILGSQPFGPLNLLTRAPVLIPRPETEHWVIKLSQYISPNTQSTQRLLDLGTGSGCIPLLLCHLWPPGAVQATGVEISGHAIRLANENSAVCGISAPHDGSFNRNTFEIIKADMLDVNLCENPKIKLPIDILTSNPPYITWHDYLKLPYSVSAFEDPKALLGGPSGLEYYHAIARFIAREGNLSSGAVVALEVGDSQAKIVGELLLRTGRMNHMDIWLDPWGKQRTVVGRTI